MESVENTYVLIIFAYESSLAGIVIGKGGVNSKQICRVTGVKLHVRDHETDPNQKNIELEGCFDQIKEAHSENNSPSKRHMLILAVGTFERAIRQSFLAEFIHSLCGCSTKGCKAFQPVTEYMMKLQGLIFTRNTNVTRIFQFDENIRGFIYEPFARLLDVNTPYQEHQVVGDEKVVIALIDVGSQPSFVSTVATSTSMMSASDSRKYGLQRADWMVYLTPEGNQEYTEMCFSTAKCEERAKSNSHKHTRTSYVGYQNCSTELERKLLERARTHVAMEQAEDVKLLGYTYTPDAVLDCVLIRSFPNFYILKLTPSTPAIFFVSVYEFFDLNPFVGHLDPVREGHELFRKGLLSEAVLALDAEVLRNPDNA
ncbi:zinc finger CCCH domain-containing protein 14-like protein [Tanacetum coccineum]|uniref:Zinc finger CCCH domain-containing protein 14-like protein n=1 Tax=Tanacetum coccineum TaxID=301880 RepID=A0ABQ4WUX5_9ASTR